MIIGVKRKTTAIESTKRFYQTVDLIISHFKRDADREKIFELSSQDTTLKNLLIATAVIHLYHNLGIRVEELSETDQNTIDSTKNLEILEKKTLLEEVEVLLRDSLNLEIDMLLRLINLEDMIISFLIEERDEKLKDKEKKEIIAKIEERIEKNLIEIVLKYPPFYFYDLIGDMVGLTDEIKMEILEEGSAFKNLSLEIEKKLIIEEKEDKFIELSTLNRMIKKVQKDFEFKSYKELQMENMPVRMIKRRLLDYNLNRFPVSLSGLKVFLESNQTKRELIEKINLALEEKINFNQFEKNILGFVKSKIVQQLKTNPNDFVYFLESMNENSFDETIYNLNKYGIFDVLHLINIDDDIAEKVNQNMIRYNIDKFDLISLSEIGKFKEEKPGYAKGDYQEYIKKKKIIDKVFIHDLNLKNYSQILLILNFNEIITNLARDIFYYIFSKIVRQISRIIEFYLKISNEKALYLLGLKKMYGITDSEQWVWVKLEELIIDRIIKRQQDLVNITNAITEPFLINGFILARLTDKSLKEGIKELKDNNSPIYENIKPLKLGHDNLSPVSYCVAYDLIKRFEHFEELRKLKIKKIIESKEKVKEIKRKEIRKQQEISTLNWIERRITSSLMRINSPGINPNQLYWQEKDTKTATDNIKLHSELKGNFLDLVIEYFHFAIEKMKSHATDIKLPEHDKLHNTVLTIIENLLEKRLGHKPSPEEIDNILEGERFEIAKQIATRIGRILDKALYSKFKKKR